MASLIAQLVKNPLAMKETQFNFWVGKTPWRRDRLPTPVFLGLPGGSVVKNPPAMRETWVQSLVKKIPWRRAWQHTVLFLPGECPWMEEPGRI